MLSVMLIVLLLRGLQPVVRAQHTIDSLISSIFQAAQRNGITEYEVQKKNKEKKKSGPSA